MRTAIALPALLVLCVSTHAAAQERDVSVKLLPSNIVHDEARTFLFPAHLSRKRNLIAAASILGATAALIVLDPHEGGYFRRTSSFSGFSNTFTSKATTVGTVLAPVALYGAGFGLRDFRMRNTALLAGEALADSEILTVFLKGITKRARPSSFAPNQNFSDNFFDSKGSFFSSKSGFPSGHTIGAFSVATVIARRYGNHRWVPYASYGAAALVGFSRLTTSAHFTSDVFLGAALGYSISRFAVLRQ